ncbi:Ca2+/Na+ antiporter [Crossiella equi]|uniref:Ca2+/Na+ antiporter n=1 Tax=Crossiella equi TaxID=130796 RepID=A0ABS5ADV9_9PSEU|nr:hypothetical protein [Crossiella equi]MBP2474399.1 Ca2+/Na+ antiporter [Crossiella equi]
MSSREWFSRYEQRRAEKFSRRLPAWRTRRHRRPLAVAFAAIPVVLVVLVLAARKDSLWFVLAWTTCYLSWVVVWWLVRVLTNTLAETMTGPLDERQRELRDTATFGGFHFGVTCLIPVMAYLFLAQHDPDAAFNGGLLVGIAIVLVGGSPSALLAWTLPDDDPQDLV